MHGKYPCEECKSEVTLSNIQYDEGSGIPNERGYAIWTLDGKLHRIGGPAVELGDGGTEWFLNGKNHRIDGPAIEYSSGATEWYLNGSLHREDGPAVEYSDGDTYWYLKGIRYTEERWKEKIRELKLAS